MSTTLRNYLSEANLASKAAITISDAAEALRQIDRAEQAIDDYVGYQCKYVEGVFRGTVTAVSGKTIYDTSNTTWLHIIDDFFKDCVIEIIGGTGEGQIMHIASSSLSGYSITTDDTWATEPDTTSFFIIYQLGKFPRQTDGHVRPDGLKYFKRIPQQIQDAVVAQVEYQIAQGDTYFQGDDSEITSERIGNYSYTKGNGSSPTSSVAQVSPRARAILKGIKNSTGVLLEDNPTEFENGTQPYFGQP